MHSKGSLHNLNSNYVTVTVFLRRAFKSILAAVICDTSTISGACIGGHFSCLERCHIRRFQIRVLMAALGNKLDDQKLMTKDALAKR